MTTIELIVGAIATVMALLFGAFQVGKSHGSSTATAEAEKTQAEQNAASETAAAERRADVIKEASDVQQTVSHMPVSDVDRELQSNWTRPDDSH